MMSSSDGENAVSQHLQDSFVYLCITSNDFLGLVRPVLVPNFFGSPISANCVRICYDFWDTFKRAPKDHFHDELISRLGEVPDVDKKFYSEYLKRVQAMSPPDFDYVIRRVSRFCQCREFEGAAIKFAELVKDGEFDAAQDVMYKAFRSGINTENAGFDYLHDFSHLYRRLETPQFLMPTGIEHLDRLIGGYERAQFLSILGGYKGKKSWALQHIAKTAMMHGLNVLYVSHELTIAKLERRMDMMYGSLVSEKEPQQIEITTRDDKTGRFETHVELRPSAYDVEAVKKARRTIGRFGGNLRVRKYPMGSCTMGELERYLNYLERFEGFVPDVLLNDYADIMSYPGVGTDQARHGINMVYMWHKKLADERNILVVTVSQGRREAIRKRVPSIADFAEDIRKAANVDTAIAVCQNEAMIKEQHFSLRVIANRDDVMDVGCMGLMNLKIGQFCMSSWFGK